MMLNELQLAQLISTCVTQQLSQQRQQQFATSHQQPFGASPSATFPAAITECCDANTKHQTLDHNNKSAQASRPQLLAVLSVIQVQEAQQYNAHVLACCLVQLVARQELRNENTATTMVKRMAKPLHTIQHQQKPRLRLTLRNQHTEKCQTQTTAPS